MARLPQLFRSTPIAALNQNPLRPPQFMGPRRIAELISTYPAIIQGIIARLQAHPEPSYDELFALLDNADRCAAMLRIAAATIEARLSGRSLGQRLLEGAVWFFTVAGFWGGCVELGEHWPGSLFTWVDLEAQRRGF